MLVLVRHDRLSADVALEPDMEFVDVPQVVDDDRLSTTNFSYELETTLCDAHIIRSLRNYEIKLFVHHIICEVGPRAPGASLCNTTRALADKFREVVAEKLTKIQPNSKILETSIDRGQRGASNPNRFRFLSAFVYFLCALAVLAPAALQLHNYATA